MKKRYLIPLLLMLLVASACLFACGNKYKTGTWGEIESKYGTQGFHCTPDASMNIDGYLDEAAWTEKCTKEFNHVELGCSFVVRSYYDVSGMYFGMVSRDYNVIYSRAYGMQQFVNSGFILSVVPEGDTTLSRKFSVGFDAGNTPRAYGLYNYLSRTTVQGVVNSGETDGMTTEVFVPWSNIGLTVESEADVPEKIRVFVRYNVISGDVGAGGTNMYPGLGNDYNYGKMYNFGKTGYCEADQNGWLLGNAADGYAKSADYDFSRADEGIYGTDASGDRTLTPNNKSIFLRNVYADRFVYTMRIRPDLQDGSAVLGKYTNRATVNLMGQTSYGMYGFGISLLKGSVDGNTVRVTRISYVGRVWTDPYEQQAFYTTQHSGSFADDGVTLTLIKDGDTYYYVYGTPEDGTYIGYDRNVIHAGAACPGVITCNSAAILSDIRCTTYGKSAEDDAEMMRILNNLGAARVTATATGGGAVTFAEDVVPVGGDAELTFRYAGGSYVIDTVKRVVGQAEEDITADVAEKAKHGKYVLKNVTTDTAVNVTFRQTETRTATVTLTPPTGFIMPAALITAEGKTDKTKYYEVRTGGTTAVMQVPAGEYDFRVIAAGLTTATFELDVTENATHAVTLTKAPYGGNVTVNGTQLSSSQEWDYTESNNNAAYRPSAPQNAIAWMSDTASGDFTLSVDYTVTSSVDTDPNGGFAISDGTTTYYVFLLGNGVRIIDATHNLGWQNRNYGAFNSAVSGSVVGKTITLTLSRTGGVWTFTATYGSATITQTLGGLTASWGSNQTGEAFALPSGEVAIGLTATDIAVAYENISLETVNQ